MQTTQGGNEPPYFYPAAHPAVPSSLAAAQPRRRQREATYRARLIRVGVELGLIRESTRMCFQLPRVLCFNPYKVSVSKNVGRSSFERSFRGGFNGNNGAFQYPNPENQIISNVDSTVLKLTVTCRNMFLG